MSKSVELLASGSEDGAVPNDAPHPEERSRLNLNGSRQLSRSATELRPTNGSPGHHHQGHSPVVHHSHHRHHISVAQRTHTFFATLKSRWSRSRSKERKKSREITASQDGVNKNTGIESDYGADYSSEHSRSSSATQSPARHYHNHPDSPLARGSKDRVPSHEGSPGRYSNGSNRLVRQGFQNIQGEGGISVEERTQGTSGSTSETSPLIQGQDEASRRRELALRQHAFFQLRLHLRQGANLVAMDRGGSSDPYVKIKSSGRLLHKSRTVHRDLNPIWDESVTLPIEDPFQPLTIKVFDYDWGLQDDFMGSAMLDLTLLELGHAQDVVLELTDPARPKQHLGNISLTLTLWPRNQQDKEQVGDKLVKYY